MHDHRAQVHLMNGQIYHHAEISVISNPLDEKQNKKYNRLYILIAIAFNQGSRAKASSNKLSAHITYTTAPPQIMGYTTTSGLTSSLLLKYPSSKGLQITDLNQKQGNLSKGSMQITSEVLHTSNQKHQMLSELLMM